MQSLSSDDSQRIKTNEQVGHEASALLEIEGQRAEQRRKATQFKSEIPTDKELVHYPETENRGQSRDIVGSKLGYSGRHIEQAATETRTAAIGRGKGVRKFRTPFYGRISPSKTMAWGSV